jgi:nucleoside-diphosphate-sugar epimerase
MTRVAAVTGGAGAIGGAIVVGLRAAGHEVVILDRDGDAPVAPAEPDAVRAAAPAGTARHRWTVSAAIATVMVHRRRLAVTGQGRYAGGPVLR